MNRRELQEYSYPEIHFGGFSQVDGTVAFFSRVQALAAEARLVVDVGCGRGARRDDPCRFRQQMADLRSEGRRVIGLDVSSVGRENPCIDVFYQIGPTEKWPLADNSVDLVVCDYVLEHVEDPGFFFSEVARILKIGGYCCARTPNKWNYVPLLSTLLPQRYHAKLLPKVQTARLEEDVFATHYRSNTTSVVRRNLRAAGLRGIILAFEAEPNYLAFNAALYRFGTFLHRLLPASLRSQLLIFAEKPRTELGPTLT